jgi:hypothetical protein
MKTIFNQIGSSGTVSATVVFLLLLSFSSVVRADVIHADTTEPTIASPVVVTLQPGVTGWQIQQALDGLPAAGGVVMLPAGKILIRQPVVLRRDFQTLRGTGADTVLWLADDANCPVIIMGEPVNQPQKILKDLCVRDVFIDGNRSHQQRELWQLRGEGSDIRNNGVTVQSVMDSTVEDVTCARCRSGGLVTTLNVRRLTVRDLDSFDNQFDGLACYETQDSLFTDLTLHDNPGAGISLDLAFDHNVISNAVLLADDLGIFMRSSHGNKFQNVSIRDCRHHGVFMAQEMEPTAKGWGHVPKTECTHNNFTNLIAANCGAAAFRVNDTTCTNNILVQANFKGNPKGGLSMVDPALMVVR